MTEPTDAELAWTALDHGVVPGEAFTDQDLYAFARAVLAKWGTPPAVAGEPVAHDEDLLEQLYWDFDSQRKKTGEERLAFKGKMRSYASEFRRRSVGKMFFSQSVSDDMMNLADRLGALPYVDPIAWKHLLVYAPQQEAVPLTDGQAKEVLWAEHLRWMRAAGLDTEGMRPTSEWLDHWLTYVRAIERAHGIGIKGGQHG